MRKLFAAWIAGFIFAMGLGVSGMTKPSKVIGFLNLSPGWDPTLAFVMGGAVLVYAIGFHLIRRRSKPVLASEFHIPAKYPIEWKLCVGAAIFGVGWGLGGYCPGPAVVAAMNGSSQTLLFVLMMVFGFVLQGMLFKNPK